MPMLIDGKIRGDAESEPDEQSEVIVFGEIARRIGLRSLAGVPSLEVAPSGRCEETLEIGHRLLAEGNDGGRAFIHLGEV